jgi:hypothetical protein
MAMHFRDRAGLTFTQRGRVLRQVSRAHAEHYDHLMNSGLYDHLVDARLMLPHTEHGLKYARTEDAYRVIHPRQAAFTSYPYEWTFSQWQAAALLVLKVARAALSFEMMLHDTSIYAVQFDGGQPVWTNPLAFMRRREGQPWGVYSAFVRQYLAPLTLIARVDVSMGRLLVFHPDGVPLETALSLLAGRLRMNFGLNNHLRKAANPRSRPRMTSADIGTLLDELRDIIAALSWTPSPDACETAAIAAPPSGGLDQRQRFLRDAMGETGAKIVWDLHAGTGVYSRIAANEYNAAVAAFNAVPDVSEALWRSLEASERERVLPLWVDWVNPSPGVGWANREMPSLLARANADMVLAFGLVHRLAVIHAVTFEAMVALFRRIAPVLLVEFVPAADPLVIALLESGQHTVPGYTQESFEAAFDTHYRLLLAEDVLKTDRRLYLMERRGDNTDA